MPDVKFELCEDLTTDTLTGKCTSRSVFIKSGARNIYISETSVRKMTEVLGLKENELSNQK